MNDKIHTSKIVLEIEWVEHPNQLNNPAQWDWNRIKNDLDLKRVKYIGTYTQGTPEKAANWIDN